MKSVRSSRRMLVTKSLMAECLHLSVSRAETSVQRPLAFPPRFLFSSKMSPEVRHWHRSPFRTRVIFCMSNVNVPCVSPKQICLLSS